MENELEVPETDSFGTELAKSFAISLAATAGMFTGMLLTGYVYGRITKAHKARKNQSTQEEG